MNRDEFYVAPLAVQVAEETLRMHDEILRLRDEVEHLREYRNAYLESLQHNIDHNKELCGIVLSALIDPESRINKAFAAEAAAAGE